MRAARRLKYERSLIGHPLGSRASFVVRRSGDTNVALTVSFELAGTAEQGTDYARYDPGSGTVVAGRIQTVVFQPGEERAEVVLSIARDEEDERPEFIRLEIIPPPGGETPYRLRRRHCATVWISDTLPCERVVPTPSGGVACIGFRSVPLPRAFFLNARCR